MATSTLRACRILKALRGKSLDGMSNKAIATAIGDSPENTHRGLADLVAEGLVTQFDNKCYALGVQMLAIATAHASEMQTAQNHLNEINQRVHAAARQMTNF